MPPFAVLSYCTGISQPPNGTILPPSARCDSYRGVRRSGASAAAANRLARGANLGSRERNIGTPKKLVGL